VTITNNTGSGEIGNTSPTKKTRAQPPQNLSINSDFIYDSTMTTATKNNEVNSKNNITEEVNRATDNDSESSTSAFDFDLVAQELANTGSVESKNKLIFIVDTFLSSRCYEWAFVLGLVLQDFTILNEIVKKMRGNDLPADIAKSLKRGLSELNEWSQNEWYRNFCC
jgi:hypothetical protein